MKQVVVVSCCWVVAATAAVAGPLDDLELPTNFSKPVQSEEGTRNKKLSECTRQKR